MSLHIHTQGSGPRLVFLHGWGLNSDVWEDVAEALSDHYTITLVDLPGHGRSGLVHNDYQLQTLAQQLAEAIPEPATWIGWSLGGLIALQLAHQFPEQVKSLVLVASSPQFVQNDEWPHAVDPKVFEQFAADLEENYQATLSRFVAIQAMGSSEAKLEVRKLRERLQRHGEPKLEALRGGLKLLQQSNLRHELGQLQCPVKMVLGRRDTLASSRAAQQLTEQYPHLDSTIIKGAAHTPFVSHPDEFLDVLTEFLQRHA